MATARLRRAAVLAALAVCTAQAAELGTLFTTPEERARLDRLRRGEPEAVMASEGVPREPVVTGYVKRSDGRNTVWIDGVPVATRKSTTLLDPRAVKPGGRESDVRIKPAVPR